MKIINIEKSEYSEILSLIVEKALVQYDLDVQTVEFVGHFTNAIMKVTDRQNRAYALRVCSPHWRTYTDLLSETIWLRDLHRTTHIPLSVPQLAQTGEALVFVQDERLQNDIICILFSWLEGSLLAHCLNEENVFQMGKLFAKLHNFSQNYVPNDPAFTQRKMHHIWARGETNRLFGSELKADVPDETWSIYHQVYEKVQQAYRQRYQEATDLMVISHDLYHENIIVSPQGVLQPFDFEDTVWGYPVQDIAMAMNDLRGDVPADQFEPYLQHFRNGYETLRSWPEQYEGQMDDFMAGRVLWCVNWVANFEHEHITSMMNKHIEILNRFLQTGRLRNLS